VFDYLRSGRASGFEVHHLLTEAIVAIVAKDDPLSGRARISLQELRQARWIAGCPRCREHLLRVCEAAGFVPEIRHALDDFVLLQHLVAAGLGIALIPGLAFETFRHPGVAILESPDLRSRDVLCITPLEAAAIPTVAAVLGALREAAAQLAPEPADGPDRR
jgi:DNA-binding transcriptional LysR family regulator